MTTALAAVFQGAKKDFLMRRYPVEEPPAGMARLGLLASGICGTDGHIWQGRLSAAAPIILGHEFIGRVEACPDNEYVKAGDTAIVCVACPCGKCEMCRSGNEANCLNMGVTYINDPANAPHLFGGFCEKSFAPVENLTRVPETLPAHTCAAFACAGPTVLHAFKLAKRANVDLSRIRRAVVQGMGAVGTFAAWYLKEMGVEKVTMTARRADPIREEKLRALGIEDFAYWDHGDVAERAGNAQLVFEGSGNPAAFQQGLDLLGNRGVYLVPGQYSVSGGVPVSPEKITFAALQVIGSSQYDQEDIDTYLDFMVKLPHRYAAVDALTAKYPLSRFPQAMEALGKSVKTIIVPEEA